MHAVVDGGVEHRQDALPESAYLPSVFFSMFGKEGFAES
jgi:hypothetical protein